MVTKTLNPIYPKNNLEYTMTNITKHRQNIYNADWKAQRKCNSRFQNNDGPGYVGTQLNSLPFVDINDPFSYFFYFLYYSIP